jgi:thermitase
MYRSTDCCIKRYRFSISQAAEGSGGKVAKSITGAVLLDFASEKGAKDAVKKLIERSDVTFVERNGFMSIPPMPVLPDLKNQKKMNLPKGDLNSSALSSESVSAESMSALSVSTDPGTGYQWHHTVIRKTAADIGDLSLTPPTVAVIDTGVDYTHPDLSGRVILGKNCVADNNDPFDDHGHGTHVA